MRVHVPAAVGTRTKFSTCQITARTTKKKFPPPRGARVHELPSVACAVRKVGAVGDLDRASSTGINWNIQYNIDEYWNLFDRN